MSPRKTLRGLLLASVFVTPVAAWAQSTPYQVLGINPATGQPYWYDGANITFDQWTLLLTKQDILGFMPLNPSNNLSELSNVPVARVNLGLGQLAVQSTLNLSYQATGSLQAAQFPALSGDCSVTAGTLTTTCLKTNGVFFSTLSTLVPGLGVANALGRDIGTPGAVLIDGTSSIGNATFVGTGATNAPTLANRVTDGGVTFNLKEDFGAACDGSTDDTNAIQAWLDKAGPGVTLLAPGGVCSFNRTLTIGHASFFTLMGAGQGTTKFQYTGNDTSDWLDINQGASSNVQGVTIKDLFFYSTTPMNGGYAISAVGLHGAVIDNLTIGGLDGAYGSNYGNACGGVLLRGPAAVSMSNPILNSNRNCGDGLRVYGDTSLGGTAEVLVFGGAIGGYNSSGTILGFTSGFHMSGGFGGLRCHSSNIHNNQVGVLIDDADWNGTTVKANREFNQDSTCAFDGNLSAGILVNSPHSGGGTVDLAGWTASSLAGPGVVIQSWPNGDVELRGNKYYNNCGPAIDIEDATAKVAIASTAVINRNWNSSLGATCTTWQAAHPDQNVGVYAGVPLTNLTSFANIPFQYLGALPFNANAHINNWYQASGGVTFLSNPTGRASLALNSATGSVSSLYYGIDDTLYWQAGGDADGWHIWDIQNSSTWAFTIDSGGNVTLGEGDSNHATVQGDLVVRKTGSTVDTAVVADAAPGRSSSFALQKGGTTKWLVQDGQADQLLVVDQANSSTQWMRVTTGGNATLGENDSNTLRVMGQIDPTNPVATRANLNIPSVSLLDFDSLACSGSGHDDTTAFNNALAAGRVVSVPQGDCYVGGSVATTADGAGLVGAGMFATTIHFTSPPSTNGASLLFASPIPGQPGYAIHKPVLRDLGLTYDSLSVTQGSLLRFQQAAAYTLDHVSLEGGYVGFDMVGGVGGYIDAFRVSSGANWANPVAGSRLVRFREQQLDPGYTNPYNGTTSFPASNVYATNLNLCPIGNSKVEDSFELTSADTVEIGTSYACGGYHSVVSFNPTNNGNGAYISNFHYSGMVDGANHTAQYNIWGSPTCNVATCQNITFVGGTINQGNTGVYFDAGPQGVSFTANNFSGNLVQDVYLHSIYSGVFASNTLHPNGNTCGIRVDTGGAGGNAGGSLTFSGNIWNTQTSSGLNLQPGICFRGVTNYGGPISVVGNNFASLVNPVGFESNTRMNVVVANNVGDWFPLSGPVINTYTYSSDVTLFDINQVVVLTGTTTFTATLPPAAGYSADGTSISITISNASSVTQNVPTFKNLSGATTTTIAAGTTVWLTSDGTNWVQQVAPSYAVGPSIDPGGTNLTLGPLQSTIYEGNAAGVTPIQLPNPTFLKGKSYTIVNLNSSPVPLVGTYGYYDFNGAAKSNIPANSSVSISATGGKWSQK